jgi:hypothetical protein
MVYANMGQDIFCFLDDGRSQTGWFLYVPFEDDDMWPPTGDDLTRARFLALVRSTREVASDWCIWLEYTIKRYDPSDWLPNPEKANVVSVVIGRHNYPTHESISLSGTVRSDCAKDISEWVGDDLGKLEQHINSIPGRR